MMKAKYLLLAFSTLCASVFADTTPWLVYYNNQASTEALEPYNPIVLNAFIHPDLEPLLKQGKTLLGYVNLGEVDDDTPYFEKAKAEGLLIAQSTSWPESYSVDIRNPVWKKMVIEEMIPHIFEQGFSGLFFDQLDVSIALEQEDPKRYAGMTAAAADLVQSIRRAFPDKVLMLNRAYEILPDVGGIVDYELAEMLYTDYNYETKKYSIRSKDDFEWQLKQLRAAQKQFPRLIILALEYWDPKDTKMYRKIYSVDRDLGFNTYVTSIAIDQITPEP